MIFATEDTESTEVIKAKTRKVSINGLRLFGFRCFFPFSYLFFYFILFSVYSVTSVAEKI